jgi:outer membrane usher protein
VPAEGTGAVVSFGVSEEHHAALVAFVDPAGVPIRTGSPGRLEGAKDEFVVGYGVEAFLRNLTARNVATVELASGKTCRAEFAYQANRGTRVKIDGVVCQ